MKLVFLGTNNWYDTNTGNTPCVLLDAKDFYIIFDAGFGLYKAGDYTKEDKPIYLFIGHFHIDQVCGLHVLPKLNPKQPLTILGGKGLKKNIKMLVNHPFMASLDELRFRTNLVELKEGRYQQPFDFECRKLNHVDYTMGYRVNVEGKIITYCADTGPCENDFLLAKDSDIFLHECALPPGHSTSWGHSNPVDAAQTAKRANVKKLILANFGANGYPTMQDREKAVMIAKKIFKNTIGAKDGMALEL